MFDTVTVLGTKIHVKPVKIIELGTTDGVTEFVVYADGKLPIIGAEHIVSGFTGRTETVYRVRIACYYSRRAERALEQRAEPIEMPLNHEERPQAAPLFLYGPNADIILKTIGIEP